MAQAELEVHAHEHGHEHAHAHDGTPFGKAVALSVSLIGVILAVVTIASHRAHTAAVIYRTEANDQWAYYQAKRDREYLAEYAASTTPLIATADTARAQELVKRYTADMAKYKSEAAKIEQDGHLAQSRSKAEEARAAYLDTSEGFFELGLVLSSIYFLARRKMFPYFGAVSAGLGAIFGVYGFFFT